MDCRLELESHLETMPPTITRAPQRAMQRTVEMELERPAFRHA